MQKSSQEEIKHLERILSENSNSTLFARLADAYLRADRVEDAIELCEFGVKKHPAYATGHFILGKCYLRKKLLDEAEKELKRAIMYDPKYIAAHREYGELMASIGWHTTCDMTFQEIVKIDPLNEKAKSRLVEIKKQFSHQEEKQKEEPDEVKFAIKEMDDTFAGKIEQIEDSKEKTDIDNLDFGESIQEEKTADGIQDTPDENEVSMDLLEDIFRDTSIPELESEELPSGEEKLDTDIEPTYTSETEEETPVVDNSEQSQLEPQSYEEPEEFQLPKENVDEGSSEEEFTPVQEQVETEPSPPTDLSEQPLWEDNLEQSTESETEIPAEEKASFEEPDQSFFGLDDKQLGGDAEIDEIKSAPSFPPEQRTTDGFVEPPKSEPESESAPPQEAIEPKQADIVEETPEKKKEKIVTPTLGEIYTAQHQYSKAINVYELLLKKEPENEVYKQKIEYLHKKLAESEDE